MFTLPKNADILTELKKSGEQFAELFVQNDAVFTLVPQAAGAHSKEPLPCYAAQVRDIVVLAKFNEHTNKYSFRSVVML